MNVVVSANASLVYGIKFNSLDYFKEFCKDIRWDESIEEMGFVIPYENDDFNMDKFIKVLNKNSIDEKNVFDYFEYGGPNLHPDDKSLILTPVCKIKKDLKKYVISTDYECVIKPERLIVPDKVINRFYDTLHKFNLNKDNQLKLNWYMCVDLDM